MTKSPPRNPTKIIPDMVKPSGKQKAEVSPISPPVTGEEEKEEQEEEMKKRNNGADIDTAVPLAQPDETTHASSSTPRKLSAAEQASLDLRAQIDYDIYIAYGILACVAVAILAIALRAYW